MTLQILPEALISQNVSKIDQTDQRNECGYLCWLIITKTGIFHL